MDTLLRITEGRTAGVLFTIWVTGMATGWVVAGQKAASHQSVNLHR